MIVKKLLEIQSTIEGRGIPFDMDDEELNQHYSESKGVFINILDMDLIHLVRSYSKCLGHINTTDKEIIREGLDKILKQVYKTREVLDD